MCRCSSVTIARTIADARRTRVHSAGAIGTLVAIAAYDLRRKPDAYYDAIWRRESGGGLMLTNGIHDLDCLRWHANRKG